MQTKLESNQNNRFRHQELFTKRKFLSFSLPQQHKKCSQLLREIYDTTSQKLFDHYNEIQQWMDGNTLETLDREEISNRYHKHLELSKQSLSEHNLLPRVRRSDKGVPHCEPWPITVYLDRIRSAHNVGSILRTVEAFSLGEVRFSLDTPFIDHSQVKKTSMGTYQYVKCSQERKLSNLPKPLILMETSEEAIPITEFLFPDTFTLAVGNEEYGCSQDLLKEADHIVEIPLRGRKNSLNVANAFAIAAAEIAKQKENKNKE